MDIPVDSAIAVSTRSNQMLDKLEQQQMKKLVLEQDRRQDDSEKRGSLSPRLALRTTFRVTDILASAPFQPWRPPPGQEESSSVSSRNSSTVEIGFQRHVDAQLRLRHPFVARACSTTFFGEIVPVD